MDELISVIVPVYNVEEYIAECIESILGQSYVNIELLLVNDGSTDRSGKICDKYAAKDSRIVVIHKQNEGVSKARNDALDRMQGQYCIFVDGDDWISGGLVEALYCQLKQQNADMVFANHLWVGQDKRHLLYPYSDKAIFNREETLRGYLMYSSSMAGRIFKKELFENVRFPKEVPIGEDSYVQAQLLLKIDKVVYVSEEVYYRRVRKESASRQTYRRADVVMLDTMEKIADMLCKESESLNNELACYMVKKYAEVLLKPGVQKDKEAYKRMKVRYRYWHRFGNGMKAEQRGMRMRFLLLKISPEVYRVLKRLAG